MKLAYQARSPRVRAVQYFSLLAMMVLISAAGQTRSVLAQDQPEQPKWTQQGNFVDGETRFLLIETEEFYLRSEASMVLMSQIRETINAQIDKIVGAGGYRFVDLDAHFLQRSIVDEEIVIQKTITDPESQKEIRRHVGYARLRFDEDFDALVDRQYQLNFKARRLQWTGLAGIIALCWMAAAYGYLRLDNATRHFYSRRLQTVAIISCLIPLIIAVWIVIAWKLF